MPVSQQDFELYSRVTGTPLPTNQSERVLMAPEVYAFSRKASSKPSILKNAAKAAGAAALLGAGAYGAHKLGVFGGNDGGGDDNGGDGYIPREQTDILNKIDRFRASLGREDDGLDGPDIASAPVNPNINPSGGTGGAAVGIQRDPLSQESVPTQTTGGLQALQLKQQIDDQNTVTNNEAYASGGKLTANPSAGGLNLSATTNLNARNPASLVNPFTNRGRFLTVGPKQVETDDGVQEIKRTATFRPDVQLGVPAPLRPAMQNLGQDLSSIWNPQRAGFQFLDQGQEHAHQGLLEGLGGVLSTAGIDATMPEVGVPLHLARMAGGVFGGLGPVAGHGIRGLESLGVIGKAVGQQAAGDIMDTARIAAYPVGQGVRAVIDKGGRDLERGVQDVTKYGPEILERAGQDINTVSQLIRNKAEQDWRTTAGIVNDFGERITGNGVEVGSDHLLADHPDIGGEETNMAPGREIHESDSLSNDVWGDSDLVGTANEQAMDNFRASQGYKGTVTGGDDELVGYAQEAPSPIQEDATPSVRDRSDSFINKLTERALNETRFDSPSLTQTYDPDDDSIGQIKNKYSEVGLTGGGDIYTKYRDHGNTNARRYTYETHPAEAEAFTDLQKRGELTGDDGVNPSLLVDALLDRTKRRLEGTDGLE